MLLSQSSASSSTDIGVAVVDCQRHCGLTDVA